MGVGDFSQSQDVQSNNLFHFMDPWIIWGFCNEQTAYQLSGWSCLFVSPPLSFFLLCIIMSLGSYFTYRALQSHDYQPLAPTESPSDTPSDTTPPIYYELTSSQIRWIWCSLLLWVIFTLSGCMTVVFHSQFQQEFTSHYTMVESILNLIISMWMSLLWICLLSCTHASYATYRFLVFMGLVTGVVVIKKAVECCLIQNASDPLVLTLLITDMMVVFLSFCVTMYLIKVSKQDILVVLDHYEEEDETIKPSREKRANFLQRATFSWLDDLIALGKTKILAMEDVWSLDKQDTCAHICHLYESHKTTNKIVWNLYSMTKYLVWYQVVCSCISCIFVLGGPYFLHKIVSQLYYDGAQWSIMHDVVMMFLCAVLRSIFDGQTYFTGRRIGLRIRSVIISQLAAKSLKRQAHVPSSLQDNGKNVLIQDDAECEPIHSDSMESNITNLMSVDTHKILEWSCYLCYLISTPFEIVLCIYMLWTVLGWSSLAGVGVMLLMIPVGGGLGKLIAKLQKKLMKMSDQRIAVTNELLSSIKIVKFFFWETSFMAKVKAARKREMAALRRYMLAVVSSRWVWWVCPIVVSFLTFMTFTKLAGNDLNATTAFTALALFNTLRAPLQIFPDTIVRTVEAFVSFNRIQTFLDEPEVEPLGLIASDSFYDHQRQVSSSSTVLLEQVEEMPLVDIPAAGFHEASFTWSRQAQKEEDHDTFSLRQLQVKFPQNKLSIVCGPTGGEMHCIEGSAFITTPRGLKRREPIAYVAQQAWLQHATIKENICFGERFDREWYNAVVYACALCRDLETLPAGDDTEVGEKGLNLSGGQKQRIALARAVYSRAKTLLLDDPLSAVDAPTARHIFDHCICKLLKGKTCILVTHAVQLCLPKADYIVLMHNGEAQFYGTSQDVLSPVIEFFELCPKSMSSERHVKKGSSNNPLPKASSAFGLESKHKRYSLGHGHEGDATSPGLGRLVEEEGKAAGSVSWAVYMTYIRASGGTVFLALVVLSFALAQFSLFASDLWLKKWASFNDIPRPSDPSEAYSSLVNRSHVTNRFSGAPMAWMTDMPFTASSLSTWSLNPTGPSYAPNYYLEFYALFSFITSLCLLFRLLVLCFGSLRASAHLHNVFLDRIIHAPMRFFDTTPLGRLMNRFSKDLQSVDQEVSYFVGDFVVNLVNGVALMLIISWVTPIFLVAMPPLALLYAFVSHAYLRSSRELKRLDSVTRSPIYSFFSEMLNGVSTIRAFGSEKRFIQENNQRVDTNHRAFFYLWVSNRWLSIRIDLLGAIAAFLTGVAILATPLLGFGTMDPGFAGLSLTYTLTFTEALLWIVRMNALMEMSLNSVERVKEYLHIEQESDTGVPVSTLASEWPSQGTIQFVHASMRYAPHLPSVLDNINLTIRGGESVGIVGRTGAGKSSLSLALFRFIELSQGAITLDGINIASITLQDLRQALTIIPQDPILFTGTIRSNLDPFHQHSDYELYTALQRAHLLEQDPPPPCILDRSLDEEYVSPLSTKSRNGSKFDLASPVSEGGTNFSQGQRQLLCLARALLRRSKIIIMDEATASVDHETDNKIQKTIREEFKGCTVLCIAHRLRQVQGDKLNSRTVIDYDRICVLDKGKVVEYGSPRDLVLLNDTLPDERSIGPTGQFRKMCEETGEMHELLECLEKGSAY